MRQEATLTSVELVVPGPPVQWKRALSNGKRRYTDPTVSEFQNRCRVAHMVEGKPWLGDGPLIVSAEFVFARKPSHLRADGTVKPSAPGWPRPDVDNLLKAPLDALQGERMLFADDSQVVELGRVVKRYAEPGEEPHTELEVSAVSVST